MPPDARPPGHLATTEVPLFVAFGFDDNPEPDGVDWAVSVFTSLTNHPGAGHAATYDGAPARASLYHTTKFADRAAHSWRGARAAGFETGSHTVEHRHGTDFDVATWTKEIGACIDGLTAAPPLGLGMPAAEILGFRTPFLEYGAAVFPVIKALGFHYDCSIEEGRERDQDGTNFFWPYTLDRGSPGHDARLKMAGVPDRKPIATWPQGLWEMPAYVVIVPPDVDAGRYGIAPGLRQKLARLHPEYFDVTTGKITGFDWNLWVDFQTTPGEFSAILNHTLDLRRAGNRAPFLFGAHTAFYSTNVHPDDAPIKSSTVAERRAAVEQFLRHALGFPEVRVVSSAAVLAWVRNPVGL